jgi:phage terminase large subunit
MAKLRIEIPAAFGKLAKAARYKGAFGGRGSGKSHAFATMLIIRCLQRTCNAVCVREFQRTLDQSVFRLLTEKIRAFGLEAGDPEAPLSEPKFHISKTHIVTSGGGRIIFEGMAAHNAESIKSLEGFDLAWVEEAQVLSQRSLDLLLPTIRVKDSEIWFTWNPRNSTDPVDAFLRGAHAPANATLVEVNYEDNPWFSDELAGEMEWARASDPEKYAHVWLGKYEEMSEARVFKNWRVATDKDLAAMEALDPERVYYFGGDWGFARDPTTLLRCWLRARTLYVDREAYAIGCEIEDTPDLFDTIENGQARHWPSMVDSARPEMISYMRRHGYPKMRAAKKGEGSVEDGIAFLQNYTIVVHPDCKHVIDELTCYRYKTDPRTDLVIPKLKDEKNHTIDSLRYATEPARRANPVGMAIEMSYVGKRSKSNRAAILDRPSFERNREEETEHEGAVADPGGLIGEHSRRRSVPDGW